MLFNLLCDLTDYLRCHVCNRADIPRTIHASHVVHCKMKREDGMFLQLCTLKMVVIIIFCVTDSDGEAVVITSGQRRRKFQNILDSDDSPVKTKPKCKRMQKAVKMK